MTEREKYLSAAVDAIGLFRLTDEGLSAFRQWWKDEAPHRRKAGLSQADVDKLTNLAKIRFKAFLQAEILGAG